MSRPPLYHVASRRGRALLGLLSPLLVLGLLAACTKKEDPSTLPDGATVLSESAAVMKQVDSVHAELVVNGTIADLPLTYAKGDINRNGDAQGSLQITSPQLIEMEFRILNGKTGYLKYPTGPWQEATLVIMAVYNPSILLNQDKGVANALATATNAKTEKSEKINGIDCWKVSAELNKAAASALVPGTLPSKLNAFFWVDKQSKRMLKAEVIYPATGGNPDAPVDLTFTEFGKSVTVSAP